MLIRPISVVSALIPVVVAVAAGCSSATDKVAAIDNAETASAVSMQACPNNDSSCPPGSFAVVCENGTHEVDTVAEIQHGQICSKKVKPGNGRGQENCACDPAHGDCGPPDGDNDADDKCRFATCAEAPDGTSCGANKMCVAGKCGAVAAAGSTPAEELVGKQVSAIGHCFSPSDECAPSRPPNSNTEFDTTAAKFSIHFEKTTLGVEGVLTSITLPFSAPWFHPKALRVTMGAPTADGAQRIQEGKARIPQGPREDDDVSIQVRKTGTHAPEVIVQFTGHGIPVPPAPSCPIDGVGDLTDVACIADTN